MVRPFISNDLVTRSHVDSLLIEADYREECQEFADNGDVDVDDSNEEGMSSEEFARYLEIREEKRLAQEKIHAAGLKLNAEPVEPVQHEYVKNPPLSADGERRAQSAANNLEPINMETPMMRQRLAHVDEFLAWQASIMDGINE